MLTCSNYTMAFTDENSRTLYFAGCETGRIQVAPGTAMRHILGTNAGVWGDRGALIHDAARIMHHELNQWADRHGADRLGVPAELILRSPVFAEAARAAANINACELDALITRRPYTAEVKPEWLDPGFTAQVYHSLTDAARKHDDARRTYDESVFEIGFGPW